MNEHLTLTPRRRTMALINIALLTFMATLDGSIVNVALPKMATYLRADTGTIAWVVTSYLLVIAATILFFGKIADSVGMRRVFLSGVAVFTAGSLLCGVSPNLPLLILARVAQGLGASAAMATNQGLVAIIFPPNERGKALGIIGSFVALGTLSGPPLGGIITDALSWHYIFLINVPVGALVFVFGLRLIPRIEPVAKGKPDVPGALIFAVAMVALFCAIIVGGERGFAHPSVLAGFAIFVAAFAFFVARERKVAVPLLDFALFKNALLSVSLLCAFLAYAALSASTIIIPFYLQNARGLSASAAGLIMAAYPLILAVVAPISGRLSDKIGCEIITFGGLLTASIGLACMGFLTASSPIPIVILFMGFMAVGNGMFQSPNTSLIMSAVPRSALGVAGSLNAFIRNFGMVFGVSTAVSLLYGLMSVSVGIPVFSYVPGLDAAFLFGMRGTYFAAAGACAIGAGFTAWRMLRARRLAPR